jgi:hypothetical protein
LHQAGDATHLDDVGLHHPDARMDDVDEGLERVGLLGRRDRNVEALRDLAHAAHVVVLHGLLEPDVAEFLERAADPDGAADRVAVVGVPREGEVVARRALRTARALAMSPGMSRSSFERSPSRRILIAAGVSARQRASTTRTVSSTVRAALPPIEA